MVAGSSLAWQTTSRMLLRHLPSAGCQGYAGMMETLSMCSETWDDSCTGARQACSVPTRDEQL